MAEKRMFSKTIIDSDMFLDMPLSAQALYFHLSMRADDDGFINNPKKIQRMVGATEDDLKLLIVKQFVITFKSGIIVIKHWKIHNSIRKDRHNETIYQNEKCLLTTDETKAYILMSTECQPKDGQMVDKLDTQNRVDKSRVDKNRIERGENLPPTLSEVLKYFSSSDFISDGEMFFNYYQSIGWKDVVDWKAKADLWEAREKKFVNKQQKEKNTVLPKEKKSELKYGGLVL